MMVPAPSQEECRLKQAYERAPIHITDMNQDIPEPSSNDGELTLRPQPIRTTDAIFKHEVPYYSNYPIQDEEEKKFVSR